ncbi:MAG: gliding motility protein GldN [Saprospiraceae bacterium]|jgi:gliding motility associated protien GldN|nr:gliding motility protein GldN [Saprospiraceae bacterium]
MKNLLQRGLYCACLWAIGSPFCATAQPIDDVVRRTIITEKQPLAYAPVREADIIWEKRVWRVIDSRQTMNFSFSYDPLPFVKLLENGIREGAITPYSNETDDFSIPLDTADLYPQLYQVDTILVNDPETGMAYYQVVRLEYDPKEVLRYRIKELWYFDKQYSTMKVRILGIAPLFVKYDENGNFLYERPLFWVYYPECREWLSHHKAPTFEQPSGMMTWEDLFETRRFDSYIMKETNIHDRRLADYLSGVDLLTEADLLKQSLFNFEHDLWSY